VTSISRDESTGVPAPAELLVMVRQRDADLLATVERLDDAALRGPSALPGWSRAHVLVHLTNLASAMARQADHALRGELVDVYDGGRPARDAGIGEGVREPDARIRAALASAVTALEARWALVAPADWDRPVRYRNGTLDGTLHCWWREIEIHLVDLDIGYRTDQWPVALAEHLTEFLGWRVPDGVSLRLVPTDRGRPRTHGVGEPVEVTGPLTDLAAWLAGRGVSPAIRSRPGGLPALTAWT